MSSLGSRAPILDRLRARVGGSPNGRVLAATAALTVFAILSRVVSMGRELILADRFGTRDTLDAYFVALAIPFFAQNVVASSLGAALIPTFIRVRDTVGRDAARQLVSNVALLTAFLLALISALLAILGPLVIPFVAKGFSTEKLTLVLVMYERLLPLIVIGGLSILWSSVLNAGERFALSGISQICVPLGPAIFVLISPEDGVDALVTGTIAGALGEAAILAVGAWLQGYVALPRRPRLDAHTRMVISQYLPAMAGAAFMSTSPIVDQAFASRLGDGNVSTLQYGNRLVSLVLGMAQTTIGTAVLPHFSRMAAAGDRAAIRITLRTYSRVILIVTVPLTVAAVLLSRPIVQLVYQHGAFTSDDTSLVAATQIGYLLQIPFYVLGIVGVRLVVAMQGSRVLFWISALNVASNCLFDFLFMRLFGIAGIAVATSAVYATSTALVFLSLGQMLSDQEREG